jgi:hypothetical protein
MLFNNTYHDINKEFIRWLSKISILNRRKHE